MMLIEHKDAVDNRTVKRYTFAHQITFVAVLHGVVRNSWNPATRAIVSTMLLKICLSICKDENTPAAVV